MRGPRRTFLIVACVIALVASGSIRISLRSFARCMLVSNIAVVPIYLVDRLLVLIPPYAPGNYFAIGYPPPTGSPIDLLASIFGPSPRFAGRGREGPRQLRRRRVGEAPLSQA